MLAYRKVNATEIGVEAALLNGREKAGLAFFTWAESPVVGAQCDTCSTIVWVRQRKDPILSEGRPSDVPEFGDAYRNYWEKKLVRFLSSLPSCPVCGSNRFGRFVNNTRFARLADGSEVPAGVKGVDMRKQAGVEVFLLDRDPDIGDQEQPG